MIEGPIPVKKLSEEVERHYIQTLPRILRAARLNAFFPDVRRLMDHLSVLDPKNHRGLYDGLELNTRAGLPSYKEWTRAQTDVRLAPKLLAQLDDRRTLTQKAKDAPGSIHEKQLKKRDYYEAIQKKKLAELGGMKATLRRVEPKEKTAYFHVTLDKLDASGLFVRFTIDMSQRASVWNQEIVRLGEAETAKQTEAFQSLIYKFASLDAELTFIKLAEVGGLGVEKVVKGTVGPIYWSKAEAPEPLRPLFEEPQDFLAMFSYSMVAIDVAESTNNDPFDAVLQRQLQNLDTTRAQAKYGYQVFKDRKFVVPPMRARVLARRLQAQGTKNLIYEAR